MSYTLRPYQIEIVNETRALMRQGHRSVLIRASTGSGKTVIAADIISGLVKKSKRCLFIVHRRELIKQSIKTFANLNIHHGVIAASFTPDPLKSVQIGSIGSLARRKFQEPDLIMWDECPHIAAKSWDNIYRKYPHAFHIGLTATPQRLDGKGLHPWFSAMVHAPEMRWLIDNNYLSDYKYYMPSNINLTGVHSRMGDYVRSEISAIIDKPSITGNAINEYKKYCPDARAVVFCSSVEHSKNVAAEFNARGIAAEHVDGGTKNSLRDQSIERFKLGITKILCNVDLFSEGFDLPDMEAVILLRPTQSLTLFLQQVGRVLRYMPGKIAIILDHVGNALRHGLPDDEREWTLEDRERGKRGASNADGPKIKLCKRCFAAQPTVTLFCKHCGYHFEIQSREVDELEGELAAVDPKELRKLRMISERSENWKAETYEDFVELGRSRGYKNAEGWAQHRIDARNKKRK